jgi:hypothetical protein
MSFLLRVETMKFFRRSPSRGGREVGARRGPGRFPQCKGHRRRGEGAVGGPVMERLSLAEGPGNRGEGCTNIVARKYVSAGKSVQM